MFKRMIEQLEKELIGTTRLRKHSVDLNHATKELKILDLCSVDFSTALQETSFVLAAGGCVALPTDTIYGLVTLSRHLTKLFEVKKRDPGKPVGLFVHTTSIINDYANLTIDEELLRKLMPGKVTLLFRRLNSTDGEPSEENELIGFRIPDDEFVRHLCQRFNEPLAQTSANVSGRPSAIAPEEFVDIWDSIDLLVVDTKRKLDEERRGSTIIDLSTDGCYKIRREGCSLEFYEDLLRSHGLTRIEFR